MARIAQRFKQDGVVFVGLFLQDTDADAREFTTHFALGFPSGLDDDTAIARLYRVRGTPTTIFVDPRQEILERTVGPMTEQALVDKVQRHLCTSWRHDAKQLFDTVAPSQPKQSAHWRNELGEAERACRGGNRKRAKHMYDHIVEEMRRPARKP